MLFGSRRTTEEERKPMRVTVRPFFLSYQARVSDPRKAKGLRHVLDAILS